MDDYERSTLLVSLIDKMEYVYSVSCFVSTRIARNNENKYIYIYKG